MNLNKEKFANLMLWKVERNLPSVFHKAVVEELKKRQAKIHKLSNKEKIKIATEMVKNGAANGGESVGDVAVAMKMIGLPKTKVIFQEVYFKSFGERDIWKHINSPSFARKYK